MKRLSSIYGCAMLFASLFLSCDKRIGPDSEPSHILLQAINTYTDDLTASVDSDSSFVIKIPYLQIAGATQALFPELYKHHGWEDKVWELYGESSFSDLWSYSLRTFLCEEFRNISVTADVTLWGREPGTELSDMFSLGHNPEVILVPRKEASDDYVFPYGYDIIKPDKVSDWINMDLYFPTQVRMSVRETPPEYPQTANLTLTVTYLNYVNNIISKEIALKNVSLKR